MTASTPDANAFHVWCALAPGEQDAVEGALEDLALATAAAGASLPEPEIRRFDRLDDIPRPQAPTFIVLSLLKESAELTAAPGEVEARLRRALADLTASGEARIFLLTVFRCVGRDGERGDRLERIRRLNLLAPQLSHDFGIDVIDLDRAFAHAGGLSLQTDYRLQGAAALALARRTVLATVFASGLDELLPYEAQEAARAASERRTQPSVAAAEASIDRPAVSADSLGFQQADGRRAQRYGLSSTRSRTLRDVLHNWRAGRVSGAETLTILRRGALRRIRRGSEAEGP